MLVENGILKEIDDKDIELLENNPKKFFEHIIGVSKLVFTYDKHIEKLEIPENVKYINEDFMADSIYLKKLIIKGNLKEFKDSLALGYDNLEQVYLGESVEKIGSHAFYDCSNLKKIAFSQNLSQIDSKAFYGCSMLEKLLLPRKIQIIKKGTFYNCKSLKKINFPYMLKSIEKNSFFDCSSLEEIKFLGRVKNIDEFAFGNCLNLKKVVFKNLDIDIKKNSFNKCPLNYFIITPKKNIVLSKEEIKDMDGLYKCYDLKLFNTAFMDFGIEKLFNKKIDFDELNKLAKNLYKNKCSMPIDFAVEVLNAEKSKDINLKYYKQLQQYFKGQSAENIHIFNVLARGLGIFEAEKKQKHISKSGNEIIEMIDYAQKAGELLKILLDNGNINISSINYSFRLMNNDGFKKEYADFMLKKEIFLKLLKINLNDKDFISKVYNRFEEVQLTNSNDRGSHRYLKPTIDKFVSFFKEDKFGEDEERLLSRELSKFYDDKELFDYAKQIKKEYEESNIKPNILDIDLEEKTLSKINNHRQSILQTSKQILNELAKIANNTFTFEWLRKDDVLNYTLGKYCNCCSHIADIGDGVVKASVIHPDVQTLIIRDKQGTIIAKSTLYVNRKEGYGVFNNVEITHSIPESAKKQIYEKYKVAIKIFAEVYNKQNPNNPLKQINVGMGFNDLYNEIVSFDEKAESFPSLNFRKYSRENKGYKGDSGEKQYMVWKDNKRKL